MERKVSNISLLKCIFIIIVAFFDKSLMFESFLSSKCAIFYILVLKVSFLKQQEILFVQQISAVAPRGQVLVLVLIHKVLSDYFATHKSSFAAQWADKFAFIFGETVWGHVSCCIWIFLPVLMVCFVVLRELVLILLDS